jgi:hypothetical protein
VSAIAIFLSPLFFVIGVVIGTPVVVSAQRSCGFAAPSSRLSSVLSSRARGCGLGFGGSVIQH